MLHPPVASSWLCLLHTNIGMLAGNYLQVAKLLQVRQVLAEREKVGALLRDAQDNHSASWGVLIWHSNGEKAVDADAVFKAGHT